MFKKKMASEETKANGKFLLENDNKKEGDAKKRTQFSSRMNDYVDTFTIHGLTRVFKTQRKEAFMWMFFILTGVLFAAVVIGRLVSKYYSYETYTDVKRIIPDKNYVPSLSICELNALQQQFFLYCGKRIRAKDINLDSYCDRSKMVKKEKMKVVKKANPWMNNMFEVEYCASWGHISNCNSEKFLTPRMNGACFTWNYNGKFYDTYYGHLELKFKYHGKNPNPTIVLIPHDSEITEVDLTKKMTLDPNKKYEITLGKTLLLRKPHPYSGCTVQAGSELDIFPGAYSRRTCMETYKMMEAYKKCGDIFDYFKSFLSEDAIREYQKNKTIGEMTKCIMNNIDIKTPKDLCPFPCKELSISVSSSTYSTPANDSNPWQFDVELQLDNVDSYTVMEEQPLYSLEQMSAEVGGFLGLVVGASLLSFIELIIFAILFILKKYYEIKSK